MTRPTDEQLRKWLALLLPNEPDIDGFIFGDEAIAHLAGFKSVKHFAEAHMSEV